LFDEVEVLTENGQGVAHTGRSSGDRIADVSVEQGADMLRGANGSQRKQAVRAWNLIVFSVGGRRLAVKADELAGISKWTGSTPTTSGMPFVSSVIRVDQAEFPVYDLAAMLHVSVRGDSLLCLMAKHPWGTLAICVDEEMPVLHTLDPTAVQPYRGGEVPTIGSFSNGMDHIPILSVSQLGVAQGG
jgi:chemotaxis signal transduction protein